MSFINHDFDDFIVEVLILLNGGEVYNPFLKHEQCPLCYKDVHDEYTILMNCGHFYHRECLMNYLKKERKCKCAANSDCEWY